MLEKVLDMIAQKVDLTIKDKDPPLKGELSDFRECHIEPDWLLVYRHLDDVLAVVATATGTHADLFGMRLWYNYTIVSVLRH